MNSLSWHFATIVSICVFKNEILNTNYRIILHNKGFISKNFRIENYELDKIVNS